MNYIFVEIFSFKIHLLFFSSLGSVRLLSEDLCLAGVAGTVGLITVTSGPATLPAEDVDIESASCSFSAVASGPDCGSSSFIKYS